MIARRLGGAIASAQVITRYTGMVAFIWCPRWPFSGNIVQVMRAYATSTTSRRAENGTATKPECLRDHQQTNPSTARTLVSSLRGLPVLPVQVRDGAGYESLGRGGANQHAGRTRETKVPWSPDMTKLHPSEYHPEFHPEFHPDACRSCRRYPCACGGQKCVCHMGVCVCGCKDRQAPANDCFDEGRGEDGDCFDCDRGERYGAQP